MSSDRTLFKAEITAYFYADGIDDACAKLGAEIADIDDESDRPRLLEPGSNIKIEPADES